MNMQKSHWPAFIVCHVIALLLLISWLVPSLRGHWDNLDNQLFYYFNGWVAHHRAAQIFWAITNVRAFDLIPFFIMLYSIMVADGFIAKDKIKNASLMFVVLLAVLILIRFVIAKYVGVNRASPSVVLQPAYLLRELVSFIPAKDTASDSFPGDHAAIIFAWLGFIFLYAKNNRCKFIAVLIAAFFTLPRLVAGAHWFTDDFVGGLFVALIALAWVFFTPFAKFITHHLQPLCDMLIAKLLPNSIKKITYDKGP